MKPDITKFWLSKYVKMKLNLQEYSFIKQLLTNWINYNQLRSLTIGTY